MIKEDIKLRSYLGFLISLVSFLFLSIIVKLCGLDLFYITNDIPILVDISDFIASNLWLKTIFLTLVFIIQMMFIVSMSADCDLKKVFIVMLWSAIPIYFLNLIIICFEFFPTVFSTLIPFIYALCFVKPRTKTDYIVCIIRFIIISVIVALVQQGLLFLKVDLLSCNYHNENMFNYILLNFDFFCVLISLYLLSKILKKRR